MQNENGIVEWMENGERCTRAVNRLMVRWPDGTLSGPVAFAGHLVLGEATDDTLWVFQPEQERERGTLANLLEWCGTYSPALALGGLIGAALYKNLGYFFG